MSAIDQYKHNHLGFIECPSSFDIVDHNPTKKIAVYELLEDITVEEKDFDGKAGDILLGGGSGEAATLRISMPETMLFFFRDNWNDFEDHENLYKSFWTCTESYIFGDGYSKLGWTPDSAIEFWLAENLCKILVDKFDQYKIYQTKLPRSKSNLTFFENDFS
jgi:hypothetical protein